MVSGSREVSWVQSARRLYLVAMAIFVVTIIIGILNATDAVEFDRNQILTHVHSGTIGWLTLGIVATAFVLFRAADARLTIALAVIVPLYIASFYTGSYPLRAIGGLAMLGAVAWLMVWLWRTYRTSTRTLPRLGITLGLSTFAYGAVVGVVLQVLFATGTSINADLIGAHAAAMVFGYLVLTSMALIEWRTRGTSDMPRAGVVQLAALFVGGLVLSIGLLLSAGQQAGGIYLLTQLIAVILFAVRVLPSAVRVDWTGTSPLRHIAAASLWVLVAMGIFMYLIAAFIAANGDTSKISTNILIASDHAVFIGVITNLSFGLLGTWVDLGRRQPLASRVSFWGINVGLIVFVIGLIADNVALKRIGAPVMGVFLLASLATYAIAMRSAPAPSAEAFEAEAQAGA